MEDNRVGDRKLLGPEVTKNAGKYMNIYDLYQRIKNKTETLMEKLMANEVLKKL